MEAEQRKDQLRWLIECAVKGDSIEGVARNIEALLNPPDAPARGDEVVVKREDLATLFRDIDNERIEQADYNRADANLRAALNTDQEGRGDSE